MKELPKIYSSRRIAIWHIIFLPVFFILFILVFKPSFFIELMSDANTGYSFNLAITSSIILVVMMVVRPLMTIITRRKSNPSYFSYILTVLIELAACVCFITLYFRLLTPDGVYFDLLGKIAFNTIAILVFPYMFLFIFAQLQILGERNEDTPGSRIRFYDDKRGLKLILASKSILYVEADVNYVTIVYLEGEKIKEFTLRNSMKNIEELCKKYRLLRCHRSYIVNVEHITSLHKEKDGIIYAKLDCNDARPIPVTQRYYLEISESL